MKFLITSVVILCFMMSSSEALKNGELAHDDNLFEVYLLMRYITHHFI